MISKYEEQLLKEPTNELLTSGLKQENNVSLHLPKNYEVALQEKNFIWFRNVTPEADLNIFFTSKPYEAKQLSQLILFLIGVTK